MGIRTLLLYVSGIRINYFVTLFVCLFVFKHVL